MTTWDDHATQMVNIWAEGIYLCLTMDACIQDVPGIIKNTSPYDCNSCLKDKLIKIKGL